jgi:hypothetical protein
VARHDYNTRISLELTKFFGFLLFWATFVAHVTKEKGLEVSTAICYTDKSIFKMRHIAENT